MFIYGARGSGKTVILKYLTATQSSKEAFGPVRLSTAATTTPLKYRRRYSA
jgi:Cdc6-like AAA superfamily ATPase